MAATEGKITVKLHLDATEFHAELDKVLERLGQLANAPHEVQQEAKELTGRIRASARIL